MICHYQAILTAAKNSENSPFFIITLYKLYYLLSTGLVIFILDLQVALFCEYRFRNLYFGLNQEVVLFGESRFSNMYFGLDLQGVLLVLRDPWGRAVS